MTSRTRSSTSPLSSSPMMSNSTPSYHLLRQSPTFSPTSTSSNHGLPHGKSIYLTPNAIFLKLAIIYTTRPTPFLTKLSHMQPLSKISECGSTQNWNLTTTSLISSTVPDNAPRSYSAASSHATLKTSNEHSPHMFARSSNTHRQFGHHPTSTS